MLLMQHVPRPTPTDHLMRVSSLQADRLLHFTIFISLTNDPFIATCAGTGTEAVARLGAAGATPTEGAETGRAAT